MKYDIIFSVAAHESEESLIDLIENVRKFVPNSLIVIHLKKGFKIRKIKETYKNVYFNPNTYDTGYLDQSLTIAHSSNIYYLIEKNIDADYFAILGSNELFVRKGLYEYIKDKYFIAYQTDEKDYHIQVAKKDKHLNTLLTKIDGKIIKSPPEGTFYKFAILKEKLRNPYIEEYLNELTCYFTSKNKITFRKISNKIARLILHITPKLKITIPSNIIRFSYASEEIFFPTIMQSPTSIRDNSYCYIKWHDNLNIDIDDIVNVNNGVHVGKYSVKRIERNILDPKRIWIKNEIN
ncbi:hypothetical protein [Xenorhabdus hominickii]|uniref:Uncharacterized protein n=1 Tax=Xenorhabdus hominickii TaxID=351679 RepID=A0A2G0QEP1_XENHO|nr:hypothetical protein [Xenorhabdus hominickii]AOM41727.1 hypothetical protein A9255_14870 [Xenorhabdus hominickii]PHM57684.1 hypothetical protein Xhom_00682 [Xenorhabdus hominickii]